MKRKMKTLLLVLFISSSFNQIHAQAFSGRGSNYTSLGWSMSELNCWFRENQKGLKGRYSPVYQGFNFQFEKGISKWIGLGVNVGAGFTGNMYSSFYRNFNYSFYNNDYRCLVIPVGFQGNFHFFQMIQDLTESNIGADKMDIYVGLGAGGGPAFLLPRNSGLESEVGLALYMDGVVGIRYYPSNNVGFYAQVGYGKSLFNVGITFHK